jgi:hypothetical protein
MIRYARGGVLAVLVALVLGGCSEPKPKPAVPPADVAVPRLGVVGLVTEVKERAMTRDNWKGVVGGLFSQDTEGNVVATRYEITVFYDDSSTGIVKVERKPNLVPGQRVRVTGNEIEPLRR